MQQAFTPKESQWLQSLIDVKWPVNQIGQFCFASVLAFIAPETVACNSAKTRCEVAVKSKQAD
jgi:hypothetical protein